MRICPKCGTKYPNDEARCCAFDRGCRAYTVEYIEPEPEPEPVIEIPVEEEPEEIEPVAEKPEEPEPVEEKPKPESKKKK